MVFTVIGPEVAADGTDAVRLPKVTAVTEGEFMPLNCTLVTPKKFAPETVTGVPEGPEAGVNPVTVGCTKKLLEVIAAPAGALSVI